VIVWDLGGVVARFRSEHRLQALAAVSGLSPQESHDRVWTSGFDARAEKGELRPREIWAAVQDSLRHQVSVTDLRHAWAAAFEPDWAVLEVIDAFRQPHALLTNNGPILDACLDHELASTVRRSPAPGWPVRGRSPRLVSGA
jgi:hypothetical protein